MRPRFLKRTFALTACGLVGACAQIAGFDSFDRGAGSASGGQVGSGGVDNGGVGDGGVTSVSGGVVGMGGSAFGGASAGGAANGGRGASGGASDGGTTLSSGGAAPSSEGGEAGEPNTAGGATSGGATSGGATSGGATSNLPPSCREAGFGVDDCGPSHDRSCCETPAVPGGSYARGNDTGYNATLSGFRLDRFEVTIGRFRHFISATAGGYLPQDGSGKHVLDGGRMLDQDGWDATAWDANITKSASEWVDVNHLRCNHSYWSDSSSSSDRLPVSCVSWFEAYAFCIWDGGYLPTAEQWDYATRGGNEQRTYPWGDTPVDHDHAVYELGNPSVPPEVGSTSALGDGRFGQSDLVGGVWEWLLTSASPVSSPCVDCSGDITSGAIVGGGFDDTADYLTTQYQYGSAGSGERWYDIGFRCARPAAP